MKWDNNYLSGWINMNKTSEYLFKWINERMNVHMSTTIQYAWRIDRMNIEKTKSMN